MAVGPNASQVFRPTELNMPDLGRIARRDRRWLAVALLVAAPAGLALRQELPDAPWPLAGALGLGIGFVLWLGFALVRELTDTTLKSERQAARALGLEVLAAVPRMRTAAQRRTHRRMLIWSCVAAAAVGGATAALQWLG
jgi:hypothetical protein